MIPNKPDSVSLPMLLLVISIVTFIGAGIYAVEYGTWDDEYKYNLKVQQSYDNSMIEEDDIIELSELTRSEHAALYEAFKETDSFLSGGTEVHIAVDEPSSLLDGTDQVFVPVESNGVIIAVAITYEGTSPDLVSTPYSPFPETIVISSLVVGLLSALWSMVYVESRRSPPSITMW